MDKPSSGNKLLPHIIGQVLRARGGGADMDDVALAAARKQSGSAPDKLTRYFLSHPIAPDVDHKAKRISAMLRRAVLLLLVIAILAGAAAAFSAFERGVRGDVNIFWLLGALLGLNVISLFLWLIFSIRAGAAEWGISGLARWALGAFHRVLRLDGQTLTAVFQLFSRGQLGRWSVSAISHGFWAAYLIAGLVACVTLLSFQRYDFMWETTLLAPQRFAQLTSALSAPLAALGLAVPNADDVAAAQDIATTTGDNQVWARFVLWSIALYGIVPRVTLLVLSWMLARLSAGRLRLDSSAPYFAQLLAQIYQPDVASEVVDADTGAEDQSTALDVPKNTVFAFENAASIVGWEIERPDWAKTLTVTDLGWHERAEDFQKALEGCASPLLICVSLKTTPDRGVAAALAPIGLLKDAHVLLLDRHSLAGRMDKTGAQQRVGDWWSLLLKLGLDAEHIHDSESDDG